MEENLNETYHWFPGRNIIERHKEIKLSKGKNKKLTRRLSCR